MSPDRVEAIRVIVGSIASDAGRLVSATLSEGHAKAVAVDSLLRAGYSVLEGSNWGGRGRRLSYSAENGVRSELVALPPMAAREGSSKKRSSPDIRVVSPVKLIVELQTRSEHGSQSALGSENILDDIQRVLDARADVFVISADRPVYEALLGTKRDPRGRKAKAAATMMMVLPSADLAGPALDMHDALTGILPFRQMISVVRSPGGEERVVAAVWTDTAVLDAKHLASQELFASQFALAGLTWRCS